MEEKINTCISTRFYVCYFLFSWYIFKRYTTNDKQPTSKNTLNVNTIIASIRITINRPTTTIDIICMHMLQFYVHCSNELCKWDKQKRELAVYWIPINFMRNFGAWKLCTRAHYILRPQTLLRSISVNKFLHQMKKFSSFQR